jgi:hypothetical protein
VALSPALSRVSLAITAIGPGTVIYARAFLAQEIKCIILLDHKMAEEERFISLQSDRYLIILERIRAATTLSSAIHAPGTIILAFEHC